MQKQIHNSQTIIFDFDGTIADSLSLVIEIFQSLVPGHDDAPEDQIEALRSLSVRHIASILGIPMWKVPFLVKRGRKIMHKRLDEVSVFAGLSEVIALLHEQGYSLHVLSSNSTENVRAYMKMQQLDRYFISINGGVGLFGKKRAIRRLCSSNKVSIDHTWYVGDEVRDVMAAKKAGVKAVAVGWGFNHPDALQDSHPDALASTPLELQKILTTNKQG